jgi:gamma-glutamylcyclotransferase (GGCT)/AIG2-like uncharacterized protein YtfP
MFATRTAALADHIALKVRGETYPGLIPKPGHRTTGTVYLDVDPASIRQLDAFEGDFYERVSLSVQIDDGRTIECDVYRVRPEHHILLLKEEWNFDEFRERLAGRFISDFLPGLTGSVRPRHDTNTD